MSFILPNGDVLGKPFSTAADLARAAGQLPASSATTAIALHDSITSRKLLQCSVWARRLPVEDLTTYFGQRVGSYFSFMQSYVDGLALPSAIATVLMVFRLRRGGKFRGPAAQALTRLGVAIWGLAVVRAMKSRQRAVVEACSDAGRISNSEVERRGDTGGVLRSVAATGAMLTGGVLRSVAETGAMLTAVKVLMIGSLNLQGYVTSKSSRIAMPALQRMSSPGGVFDAEDFIKGLVPVVVHSLVVNAVNQQYTAVCVSQSARDGSGSPAVIVKRLCFEGLDIFLPLWYLAVVRADKPALVDELLSMFRNDPVRRLVVESILPLVRSRQVASFLRVMFLRSRNLHKAPQDRLAFLCRALLAARIEETGAGEKTPVHTSLDHSEMEIRCTEVLDAWEDFDDWVEMVGQFTTLLLLGPNALFIFPAALLSNLLEARSDVFKLCCCLRRPAPEPSDAVSRDIRTWHHTLELIAYVGAAVNIGTAVRLFAIAANQRS